MKGKSMVEGAPWKSIVKFALPVMFGSLLQQLYNTADTAIVGHFGNKTALPAVGTTGSIAFLFLAIAIGFSAGNGVLVAQHYGAKDEEKVRSNAATGITLLIVLGAIVSVLGIIAAKPIFKYILTVPSANLNQSILYFRIYAAGLIFQYGYNIFSSILRSVGDSLATLLFLMLSSVINVLLDLLFVAVFKWDVAGAAVATVISQFISFMAAYLYMRKKYFVFRFQWSDYNLDRDNVFNTIKVGTPIALQMIVISCGQTLIQRVVNQFGDAMMASFTAAQRIEMYINIPCMAMQTTMATYAGQNIGAGRLDRVKKGLRQAMVINMVFTLFISVLIWIFPNAITQLFNLNAQASIYCFDHLRTIALVNLILAMYIPLFGVYQGAGHSMFPMIVAIFALSVRVMVTYLFRYSTFLGYSIIWWNSLFGFGTGLILTWSYYFSKRWQRGIKSV